MAWLVVLEVSVFSVCLFFNTNEQNIDGTHSRMYYIAVGGDIHIIKVCGTVTRSIYVMKCYIE